MTTKILLINPPHTAIGRRFPKEYLPPLGLLSMSRSFVDAGFDVTLLDAEYGRMSLFDIVRACRKQVPQYVVLGNPGTTSTHATVVMLCAMLKFFMPNLLIVCGGKCPPQCHDQGLNGSTHSDIRVYDEGEYR
jgi:anaerobic magnesium-protoporphyrin IX monomethyl ester cyclase